MATTGSLIEGLRSRVTGLGFPGTGSAPARIVIEAPGAPPRRLPLKTGEQLCADDPQADIILLGMAPASGFRFAWSEGSAEVQVAALDAGLLVNGRAVQPGELLTFALPFTLNAGSIRLSFEGGAARAQPARQIPKSVKLAGLVAIGAAALAMVLPSRLDPPWPGAGNPGSGGQAEPRWTSAADASASIKRILARFDLSQRVQVSEQGRGIRLSGEVGGSEVRRWQDAWAMIRSRSDVPVDSMVRLDPAESMAGRSIGGVAVTPDKYVVARNGQRIRVGETLPDGWVVREISDKRVLLERDGFSESISF